MAVFKPFQLSLLLLSCTRVAVKRGVNTGVVECVIAGLAGEERTAILRISILTCIIVGSENCGELHCVCVAYVCGEGHYRAYGGGGMHLSKSTSNRQVGKRRGPVSIRRVNCRRNTAVEMNVQGRVYCGVY